MQNKPKPSIPMPSKRTSVMATSPKRRDTRRLTDSSSDEDSILNESSSTASERERNRRQYRRPFSIDQSLPNSSDTSTHSSPAHERNHQRYSHQSQQQPSLIPRIVHEHAKASGFSTPDSAKVNQIRRSHIQSQPLPPPPTLFKNPPESNQNQVIKHVSTTNSSSNRINGLQSQQSHNDYTNETPPERPERVSSKISDHSVNHLADIMQNLAPGIGNFQSDVPDSASLNKEDSESIGNY